MQELQNSMGIQQLDASVETFQKLSVSTKNSYLPNPIVAVQLLVKEMEIPLFVRMAPLIISISHVKLMEKPI